MYLQEIGECECCSRIDTPVTIRYGNMKMCDECYVSEQAAYKNSQTPENIQSRVNKSNETMSIAIEAAKLIDNSITVRTDIFNAKTVAIIELKKSIDSDSSIINKPYALAELLKNRFNHFKSVIFDLNEQIVDAGNEQKAIQVYLNTLANSLRVEEREKLKIADINYQPSRIKPAKINPITTKSSKKIDKKEVEKYAKELGIGAYNIQAICISKGISPEQAANMIRKSLNEAKSETSTS